MEYYVYPSGCTESETDPIPDYQTHQVWTNELKQLHPRYCYVNVDTAHAVKIRTPFAPRVSPDQEYLEHILSTYRQLYQTSRSQAEKNVRGSELAGLTARDSAACPHLGNVLEWV